MQTTPQRGIILFATLLKIHGAWRATDLFAQSGDHSRRKPQPAANSVRPPSVAPAAAPASPAAAPASVEPAVRKPAAGTLGTLNVLETSTPTQEQKEQKILLLALARQLGFAVVDIRALRRDFAQQLFSRMTNRLGKSVYQTISFCISMPRHAAEQIFPASLLVGQTKNSLDWVASSQQEIRLLIGDLLSSISPAAAGLTRAVQPPSESVARVFSVMMPTVEIQHAVLPYGAERLYFQCQYVLFDNSAELHPPKDSDRREIAMSENMITELRQQVLQDILTLSQRDAPLSAAWWRQLGREEMALEVEAGRVTKRQRERHAAAATSTALVRASATAAAPVYEIDCILKEVPTAGAAKIWYLVRWVGYEPSWERWRIHGEEGTALETWEPLRV